MSADDFQTKYASVMESMLKSAVAETTKLFETMVDELKAEIARIKKENEDLKSRCSRVESARSRPTDSAGSEPPPRRDYGSEKRDTATQCDLVPFHMMLVEQCQPLRHSSLHNHKQLSDYEGMEYILQDHNYDTHGEGNSQMGLLLVKQEEEEVGSTVVSGQVLSDKADSLWASGTNNEGPLINKVCSTREVPLPQRHEDTQLALEHRLLGTYSSLQGGQNQSSEPEHSFVISLATIKDDIEEESDVSQKMSEVGTQGESEKHQMVFAQHESEAGSLEKEKPSVVPQQCRREGKTSENEQTDDMQSAEKLQPVPLNKGEACDELKNGVAEVDSSSQPDMPVRRKRGRPPKKAKRLQQKEILKSPSSNVPTVQEVHKSFMIRVEEVEVSSANDTAKITSSESSQTSSPFQSSSIITLSVQESRRCSSKKAKLSESQQPSLDIKEGAIQAPSTDVSSAIETQYTPPAESPQAPSVQPRERCTSVTLQDAMLLVEAMNQSMEENTHEAAGNLPIPTPTNEAQPHIKVVKPKQQHAVSLSNTTTFSIPPSTAPTQTSVQSPQQHHPHCLITPVVSSRQSNTVPHRIILVQRSSLMPHNTASQTSAQLPTVMSTVSVENNSTLPGSTVADLPFKTPSSVPQKTAGLTLASKDPQSVSVLYPKVTIIIPRHKSPVTAKKNQSQNIHVTAQKSDNTSGYKKSPKQTASVSETLNAHTETRPSLNIPVGLVPTSVSAVPPTFEQKCAAVVRLTKLPFPISTTESVLVSEWPTIRSSDPLPILKEGSTHEKPSSSVVISKQPSEMLVLSSDICPNLKETSLSVSVNTSQISEEPNDIQKKASLFLENCTTLKESPNSGNNVPTSAPSKELEPVFEKSTIAIHTTDPLAVSGTAGECTSNLDKEIRIAVQDCALPNEGPIKKKPSNAHIHLTSITSKDTSDPHFQMTKTQFLAQLAVTPVTQDQTQVSSNDSVDTRASCAETNISDKKRLQKTYLLAQLRSHVQTHSQAKRTETNPEPCTETETQTETWTLSSKKPRLEGDHPYSKNSTCEAILFCPNNPRAAEDVIFLKETTNDLTPISSRGSELYEDDVKPSRTVSESSVSSSMCKATSESTPVSPRRSSRDATTPKVTTNYSVRPRRTSSTRDIANSKMTKAGGSPNNTKTTPLRPKRTSLRRDSASPKKTKSTSVSPRTSGLSKNGTSRNGVSSRKTRETTSVKKHRLSQDGTSPKLRVVIAKLGKAGAAKTTAKNKSSNQSKVQNGAKTSQLAENPASCEVQKKCTAKAVWTPPKTPTSKTPPAWGKRSGRSPVKTETVSPKSPDDTLVYPHSVSLHPIPVKAPPVVSPLQPLSVIGRRLLKNQCGECGRVLSSSAALESHVRLHAGWRPFSCKLCGKGFTDSKGLKRHGRVHRNGRIHICQQCGKGFVYRFGLTKHLQAVHRRIKPYVCQFCNKGFFTKIDVEAHIRMHTGEKPFHCNLCDKKFTRRVELNVHLRWHNGEKRHWCPYCGKGFLDFNNMKRHKYIHTGEKPHSCPHCPKHFTQSGHLKKHVKNVHKIL